MFERYEEKSFMRILKVEALPEPLPDPEDAQIKEMVRKLPSTNNNTSSDFKYFIFLEITQSSSPGG